MHSIVILVYGLCTAERDYISILSGKSGCLSFVGRVGGKQRVNLQSPGDAFVSIQYQYILSKAWDYFDKETRILLRFGASSDYESVMHYFAKAFSINEQTIIIPLAK